MIFNLCVSPKGKKLSSCVLFAKKLQNLKTEEKVASRRREKDFVEANKNYFEKFDGKKEFLA